MKSAYLIVLAGALVSAQALAARDDHVTGIDEGGRSVLLYLDGTWTYDPDDVEEESEPMPEPALPPVPAVEIPTTGPIPFARGGYLLDLDREKWRAQPNAGDALRMVFAHQSGEVFATIIAERMQVRIESMEAILEENAKEGDYTDYAVVNRSMVPINGMEVLLLEIKTTFKGVPLRFLTACFSTPKGTLQVHTHTSENLFTEYRAVMREFIQRVRLGGGR